MKRLLYSISLVGLITLATSCGKGWLTDLASNPNQPSEAPGTLILPPILTGYASNVIDGYNDVGAWMGFYSFSGGYSISVQTATYWVDQSTPRVTWDPIFNILKNAAYMESSNQGVENMENFVATAKILKALGYQYIVDAYGMAPYTDAFQGSANFFPKYDDGQAIYTACIAQLDSAINIIQNAGVDAISMGTNDVMFGGDMEQWAKFANTLKLRFLVRQSNVINAADAKAEIQKTADVGYLEDDALVNPGYTNTAGKQSPLWGDLGTDPGGSLHSDGYNYRRGGAAMVNFYKTNNDRRLFYVYAPDGSSPAKSAFFDLDDDFANYHGVYYGDRTTAADQNNGGTVGIGNGVMSGYDASVPLITAAESYFLQAEAVQRGWMTGNAQELYEAGITASYVYLYTQAGDSKASAEADAKAYYSQSKDLVGWGSSSNKIEAIVIQKWAASAITDNFEAWCEYRRTGYPNVSILPLSKYPANTGRTIPTKFMYPKSEADRNAQNYSAAVSKGNDPQSTKIFWMK